MDPISIGIGLVVGVGATFAGTKVVEHYEDNNPEKVYNRMERDFHRLSLFQFEYESKQRFADHVLTAGQRRSQDRLLAGRSMQRRLAAQQEEDVYGMRAAVDRADYDMAPVHSRARFERTDVGGDVQQTLKAILREVQELKAENKNLREENVRLQGEISALRSAQVQPHP